MSLKQHYVNLFNQFGASPHSTQQSSKQTQYKRFEILTTEIEPEDSILDVGCGLGDMLEFLRSERKFTGTYLGLDFVPEFISHAQKTFKNDSNASFKEFDLISDSLHSNFDVIVVSGVFNNEMDNNWGFLVSTLKKLYQSSNRVLSINALSTYVDYQDEGLYYIDPLKLFDFCKKEISPLINLRHNYLVKEGSIPYEFTLSLYK